MKSPQSLALIILFTASYCAAEDREWQRIHDGKRVVAEYVRFTNGKAVLRRSDKKLFAVSIEALTFQDREYLAKLAPAEMAGAKMRRYPSAISRYELATADDLYYARILNQVHAAADKSVEKWPMFKQLKSEVGSGIAQLLDAKTVTLHTATTCDAGGLESPLAPVQSMVADCAQILEVPTPHVRIRNNRTPAAYVFGHDEPFLVINSGLLELFEDSPEELRFVIGHELGHLKCHHLEMNAIGYGAVGMLSDVAPAIIAKLASTIPTADPKAAEETTKKIITPLLFGQLFSWRRESEFTADRAGLLCCQDTGVALEALWRLKHGIRKGSRWYDETKKVNVEEVLADLQYWENKPFIDLVRELNSSTHPFIEQRMAMLKRWHENGAMDEILSRKNSIKSELFVTVDRVGIDKFTSSGKLRDVYLKGYVEDTLWFTTPTQNDRSAVIWEKQPTSMRIQSGQPVFFELWEDGTVYDKMIGVFVVYPRAEITQYKRPFREDVESRPEMGITPSAKLKLSTYPIKSE